MFDFSMTLSTNTRVMQAQYARAGRKAGCACNNEPCTCSDEMQSDEVTSGPQDVLDLGNSRGLAPNADTLMAILEDKVNAKVEGKFKADGDGKDAEDDKDYWSPEKTAGRIVNFALKFYDKFAEKNGGESADTVDKFLGIVKGAIDEGIGQAQDVIGKASGGKVPEENQSVIAKTRDAIGSLLDEFRKEVLDRLQKGEPTQDKTDAPAVASAAPATSETIH